ncbi:hypothetical protein [Oceanicaulis sp.]|uniref:hypothetical protein n=1 Tax=Oceanicaulis sp. TaxID=1924941 RepID=UPI003F727765
MTPEEEEEAFRKDKAIALKRAIPVGICMCLLFVALNYTSLDWVTGVFALTVGAGIGTAVYFGTLYGTKS